MLQTPECQHLLATSYSTILAKVINNFLRIKRAFVFFFFRTSSIGLFEYLTVLIIASFQISSAQHIPMACQLCQLLCLRHWGHGEEQMKKSFCLSKSNMQEQIIWMHSKLLSGIYSTLFSFTFDSIHSYFLKFLLSAPFTGFSSCVCPFGADISKVLGLALFS